MAITRKDDAILEENPLWYKDAIIYQLHVKTFCDSNGDGIGDFQGLTQKLDYLQRLGITAIWLLPFYPSPLKDDGYDIAHYTDIHPSYGTLRDFKAFLRQAHRRGLRVITELPVNHTSDQHPWFQRARKAKPGSRWRDFYVWSDTPDKYSQARIIFQDFESSNWNWDSVAGAYFWHRFYSHQPDLNFDNSNVRKAVFRALDFWLEMGVDGMRLDAVPYLHEREGTNCENLPETHGFLKKLRAHIDARHRDRMLLAEANQWPEDAAAYFGNGDECHMNFHFPLMPRLFMALRMEDRFPIIDILDQTPEIPESCQWAVFLRNHDELTLEMVTDEERDYMYRMYARDPQMRLNLGIRRRLSPLLGNHRRRIELMNALLLSMPGSPILYYGDEIGMGDNVFLGDRDGVRTPMQWSPDRNAGFSRANPQRLYLPVIIDPEYHYEVINVESLEGNQHSLLWWMRRMIGLRKRYKAFSRGTLEFLQPDNPSILAFVRRYEDEHLLVVVNLSRYVQFVKLDLSGYAGAALIELFGRMAFPGVEKTPYFLTLGPHSFYWFQLQPAETFQPAELHATEQKTLPLFKLSRSIEEVFTEKYASRLEALLTQYLGSQRWFGGKARQIKTGRLREILPLEGDGYKAFLMFLETAYMDGGTETYQLSMSYAAGKRAQEIRSHSASRVLARLQFKNTTEEGILYDPLADKSFDNLLLQILARGYRKKGIAGELKAAMGPTFRKILQTDSTPPEPSIIAADQSNSSIVYGNRFILKLFRQVQDGLNPDLEIGRMLTKNRFQHVPPVAGAIEYASGKDEPKTLAILQGYIGNQGDAWQYTINLLNSYFKQLIEESLAKKQASNPNASIIDLSQESPPREAVDRIGLYLESVRLLARRTAELHLILTSDTSDPAFAPEPFSKLYQRSIYQSMRATTKRNLTLLRRRLPDLPEEIKPLAIRVLEAEKAIIERFRRLLDRQIDARRSRCHGDYHLGQVLYTGKDFVIIDFEGEPARPISERRIKRSPLRDVAGMLRSFHYAAHFALMEVEERGQSRPGERPFLGSWANYWHMWVGAMFLKDYLNVSAQGKFLPSNHEDLCVLLDIYLLEKSIYELGYELNNRPDWAQIPLHGICQLTGALQA
ncbi:MAG: maltose alpha-D-glucosyltransferase [Desulfobacterales bacterium]|nr:maltose alpha-D-glucosyltransferase [Desulfobacterales bacterium]